MAKSDRHYIGERKGKGGTFYSTKDGDWSANRQTIYKDTGSGSKKLSGHYNPKSGKFSK